MIEMHVTNDRVVTPETVTSDRLVTPKRDRAEYMRENRARRAANFASQEFNDQINPEFKLNGGIPRPNIETHPEIRSEIPVAEKSESEKYQEEIGKADDAKTRLLQQLEQLRKSEDLHRQHQAQVNEPTNK
jgi:hypothetical protein